MLDVNAVFFLSSYIASLLKTHQTESSSNSFTQSHLVWPLPLSAGPLFSHPSHHPHLIHHIFHTPCPLAQVVSLWGMAGQLLHHSLFGSNATPFTQFSDSSPTAAASCPRQSAPSPCIPVLSHEHLSRGL